MCDAAGCSSALRRSAGLLAGGSAAAEDGWLRLDEHQLKQLVAEYSAAVATVNELLTVIGGCSDHAGVCATPQLPCNAAALAGEPCMRDAAAPPPADDIDPSEWQVPPWCVPIHANVTTFDWRCLYEATSFDVIMMDPPWQLATANPTRGVALGYSQLTDADVQALPIPKLQQHGLLFIWVINAKYKFTLDLFERWGYTLVDEIVWVKMTVNRRVFKSHGYYLQHAKEVCLVGQRGGGPPGLRHGVCSDVIYAERRGQSQKPEEVYQLIEALVPEGRYLEIFARKNNLRNHWVSLGNEVTGTGLPQADVAALKAHQAIPGAVYGRGATSAAAV